MGNFKILFVKWGNRKKVEIEVWSALLTFTCNNLPLTSTFCGVCCVHYQCRFAKITRVAERLAGFFLIESMSTVRARIVVFIITLTRRTNVCKNRKSLKLGILPTCKTPLFRWFWGFYYCDKF